MVYFNHMNNLYIEPTIMSREEALLQNPLSIAPENIINLQEICIVEFLGFDKKIHQGQIVVNRNVADDIRDLFVYMLSISFPIQSVVPVSHPNIKWADDTSVSYNISSGFNYRNIAGTNRLSWHAKGLAIDINPIQNPYIRFDDTGKELWRAPKDGVYDVTTPGTLYKNHPIVLFLQKRGWEWGGDWTVGRVDYQHFEKHLEL